VAKKKSAAPPVLPIERIERFGIPVEGKDQLFYYRWAFAKRMSIDSGAPPRLKLFRQMTDILAPGWFEWHTWTERQIGGLCDNQWVGLAGCAGSAKTRNVAGFACAWWLAAPEISSVIFCSTTVKSLRKRGWAEVQNFYTSIPGPRIGNFVDSRMLWQVAKGEDKHAIVGIAVEEGSTAKVADNIKGIHTRRQLIVIDEATAIPTAIFEAATNMVNYPEEFMMVVIGNPRSRLDEMGKFCEPAGGWQSVSVETEDWETREQMNGLHGLVVRFDAEKSPNIVEGKVVSKHLPTKEKVEARRKMLGSENDPTYWSNDRGFWAPEGITKCVFTETAMIKHNAFGTHTFSGNRFSIIGSFDPARIGGDRRALRFAAIGETEPDKWGIEMMPPIIIPVNATSTNPIDYQIVEQVRRECEAVTWRGQRYSCPPENLGIDATGGGADLCDIFERMWSPHIMRIVFSGSASEDACNLEDVRPANEVYRNKRAEMYFRARNALNAEQLRGFDRETAREITTVEFDDSKPLMVMVSKTDYKKLFGKSPDLSDTVAMLLEVARRKGFRLAPVGKTVNRHDEWNRIVEQTQSVFSDAGYVEEEVDTEEMMV